MALGKENARVGKVRGTRYQTVVCRAAAKTALIRFVLPRRVWQEPAPEIDAAARNAVREAMAALEFPEDACKIVDISRGTRRAAGDPVTPAILVSLVFTGKFNDYEKTASCAAQLADHIRQFMTSTAKDQLATVFHNPLWGAEVQFLTDTSPSKFLGGGDPVWCTLSLPRVDVPQTPGVATTPRSTHTETASSDNGMFPSTWINAKAPQITSEPQLPPQTAVLLQEAEKIFTEARRTAENVQNFVFEISAGRLARAQQRYAELVRRQEHKVSAQRTQLKQESVRRETAATRIKRAWCASKGYDYSRFSLTVPSGSNMAVAEYSFQPSHVIATPMTQQALKASGQCEHALRPFGEAAENEHHAHQMSRSCSVDAVGGVQREEVVSVAAWMRSGVGSKVETKPKDINNQGETDNAPANFEDETRPRFAFGDHLKSRNVHVSVDGLSLRHTDSSGNGDFGVAFSSAPVPRFPFVFFAVRVDKVLPECDDGLAIGVTIELPSKTTAPNYPGADEVPYCWSIGFDGRIVMPGVSEDSLPTVGWKPQDLCVGDIVGLRVEADGNTMQVVVNGRTAAVAENTNIPMDGPLYAVVDLIGGTQGVTLLNDAVPPNRHVLLGAAASTPSLPHLGTTAEVHQQPLPSVHAGTTATALTLLSQAKPMRHDQPLSAVERLITPQSSCLSASGRAVDGVSTVAENTNIPMDGPLYPVVDLIGGTQAVPPNRHVLVSAAASTPSLPHSGTTAEVHHVISTPGCSAEVPGGADATFRFSHLHSSQNLIVSADGLKLRHKNPMTMFGVAFTTKALVPVPGGGYFEVRLESTTVGVDDGLVVGVTGKWQQEGCNFQVADQIPFSWSFGYDGLAKLEGNRELVDIPWNPSSLRAGDHVGLFISSDGCAEVSVNGRVVIEKVLQSVPAPSELYPFVDVLGTATALTLLPQAKPTRREQSLSGFDRALITPQSLCLSAGGRAVERVSDESDEFCTLIGNGPMPGVSGGLAFEILIEGVSNDPGAEDEGMTIGVTAKHPWLFTKAFDGAEAVPDSVTIGYGGQVYRSANDGYEVVRWNPSVLKVGDSVVFFVDDNGWAHVLLNDEEVHNVHDPLFKKRPLYPIVALLGRTMSVSLDVQ